jgi:hypothetical protein
MIFIIKYYKYQMKYQKLYNYLKVWTEIQNSEFKNWTEIQNSEFKNWTEIQNSEFKNNWEFSPNYSYRNWTEQLLVERNEKKLLSEMCGYKNERTKVYAELICSSYLEQREKDIRDWFWERQIKMEIFLDSNSPLKIMDRQKYIWWYINTIENIADDEIRKEAEIKEKERMRKLYQKFRKFKIEKNKLEKSLKIWNNLNEFK